MNTYDLLIIGSGAAGLSLALKLAANAQVALLAKDKLTDGASWYAQGGVSAVLNEHGSQDSIASHVADTLSAGDGLSDPAVVRFVVEQAPLCIDWLVQQGVDFTRIDGSYDQRVQFHLHQEGGHSHRRIIHAADATGQAIIKKLAAAVRQHPNIHLFEYHLAIDLITSATLGEAAEKTQPRCFGAYVLDCKHHHIKTFSAEHVVIASGGAGKVYLYTSNPDSCTGDGIAMAERAGCTIANMEFIQFHPTCLYHPAAKSFLISEALRGEGAQLILDNGKRFMDRYDARGELAPRDIVARAIDNEMKRGGLDCVYLDISHRSAEFISTHFPTIMHHCQTLGIDITQQPIPVVPAAHYTCGGVVIDRYGRTELSRLYAIGETSCSGLHGANRMASNSLLECLVFADSAATAIQQSLMATPSTARTLPAWDESQVHDSDEEVVVSHNWDELRRFMWDYVGIVRTTKRLQRAAQRVALLKVEVADYYRRFKINKDLIELRNLVTVAELIIVSALTRKESRGLHYSLDYPQRLSQPQPTRVSSR